MCLVVAIIIQMSEWCWAEEFKYEPEDNKSQNITLQFNNLKFKWKMNKIEAKYEVVDYVNIRTNFTVIDNFNTQSVVLLTFEW